jgi:glycosyltransferase involved in cell wall biosynthesis
LTTRPLDHLTTSSFRVSVIVPVCDAARFVRQAVESALAQAETGEVLLVEDASSDNSLQVCEQLAREYPRVRLLRHADGRNHGAGASRNLGIASARLEFVAFLDADDYFLPGRFTAARAIFEDDPEVEGVYEAMGVEFEDEAGRRRWLAERGPETLTTMTERVAPGELFERQGPVGPGRYCPTGGWVIRRSVFAKTGLFETSLRHHEDTVMFVKFAAVGKMLPGRLEEPVVVRRVHSANRSTLARPPAVIYEDRIRMWAALWLWGRARLGRPRRQLLLRRFLEYAGGSPASLKSTSDRFSRAARMSRLGLKYPALLPERDFWVSCLRALLSLRLRGALKQLAGVRRWTKSEVRR